MNSRKNKNYSKWVILALLLLSVVASIIYKNSKGKDFYRLRASQEVIKEIQKANFNLDRLILKSRFHFMGHYDLLNKSLKEIKALNERLAGLVNPESEKTDYFLNLEKINSFVKNKEIQVEIFKSRNSFYKNSERYLPVLLKEAAVLSRDSSFRQDVETISHLILDFITQPALDKKQELLKVKSRMLSKVSEKNKTKALQAITHLNIVVGVGTELDKLIKDIVSNDVESALQDLSKQISAELVSNEKEASFFYYLLGLFCVFLIGFTVRFILNLEKMVSDRTKELVKAKDLAEEGIKAKARFLATMSHEIRTPMNAVLSCANLLLDNAKKSEDIRLLKTVQNSGDTLLTLINDILDFSKIESGKMDLESEPFALHENTKEIVDLLSSKASEKGCTLSCTIDEATPLWIEGDVTRFRQVLTNLIGNAVKFTKDKAQVTLKSKELGNGKHEIEVSVIDNGIGMPEEAKSKLFQDFSQVDASTTREFGGTGLGLAICKGIIDAMDGKIWAESELDKGSTFTFTMLATETEAGESKKKIKLSEINPNMAIEHPLKILMAEDNTVNQMVAKKLISKLGYRIDVVANGLEALQAVKNNDYDIVLMDQHMPEMDGIEATIKIRQFASDKPKIYALTASAFKEDKDRCMDAGMDGFLTKPINVTEIVMAFNECAPNNELFEKCQETIIDMDALYGQFDGMGEVIGEIAEQCLQSLPQYLNDIEQAITNQDNRALENLAHTLKGTVANFQADSVVEVALKLEIMGRKNKTRDVQPTFQVLKKRVEKLTFELRELCDQKAA